MFSKTQLLLLPPHMGVEVIESLKTLGQRWSIDEFVWRAVTGKESWIIFNLTISCQLIRAGWAGCLVPITRVLISTKLLLLLFVMDKSAIDIWFPSAVNKRTLLSGFTLHCSCRAMLLLMRVWLQLVSGRQLTTMPDSTGRSAKASHNGSSGVGREEFST